MTYTSLGYFILVGAAVLLYYLLPLGKRWTALLAGSMVFYVLAVRSPARLALFFASLLFCYAAGRLLERWRERPRRRAALAAFVLLSAAPLLLPKFGALWGSLRHTRGGFAWVLPMGLSFYTLQMIAYLADVYAGRVHAERSLPKFALFLSFFPQILQGPIPRFERLAPQLEEGHAFDGKNFVSGLQLILWGFFLKWMIADKAAVAVSRVFDAFPEYQGSLVLLGGALYCFQLYADFLSCVTLAQGVAALFGIRLEDNFRRPFFSASVQELWRRWHISLGGWLRDYVYIPLGGSRKGPLRKTCNLMLTFLVSGFWHGAEPHYLAWGLLQAVYQIIGSLTKPLRERVCGLLHLSRDSLLRRVVSVLFTFFLTVTSWILFRAENLGRGLAMLRSLFTVFNPWALLDGSLLLLGLDEKDWAVLLLSLLLLFFVSLWQERGGRIREWLGRQHLLLRWGVCFAAILAVILFGTYGYGYQAQDFIYGAF